MSMIGVFIKTELHVQEDFHIIETQFHVSCVSADDAEVVEGRDQIF